MCRDECSYCIVKGRVKIIGISDRKSICSGGNTLAIRRYAHHTEYLAKRINTEICIMAMSSKYAYNIDMMYSMMFVIQAIQPQSTLGYQDDARLPKGL